MKNKVLLFTFLGLGVLATSCKKDFTCDCSVVTKVTYNDDWSDLLDDYESTTSNSQTLKMKKKDAESWCKDLNSSISVSDFSSTSTINSSCNLK
ncbi:MAG: hypothetical protein AB8B74_10015 [Crocinitomicaceae bacterium]